MVKIYFINQEKSLWVFNMKKAELAWEKIGNLIIVLIVLIILIAIAILFKDKLYEVLEKIKDFVRFKT